MENKIGFKSYIMLLIAAGLYGSLFSLNKVAAESGWPPVGYAFWTSVLAGGFLWFVTWVEGRPPKWNWPFLRVYLVIGGLGIAFSTSLLTYVAPKLPAGILGMVLALTPGFTYLISIIVRLEKFYFIGVLGIIFGFIGVGVLIGPSAALPTIEVAGWFLISLLAPLCFAMANVAAAALRPPQTSSLSMAAGILLASALVVSPFMFTMGQWDAPGQLHSGDWALVGSAAVNCVVVLLFLEIVRIAGPTFFSQFNYLAVLAGIGWGALLFGERLGFGVWFAVLLMALGVVLTSVRARFFAR